MTYRELAALALCFHGVFAPYGGNDSSLSMHAALDASPQNASGRASAKHVGVLRLPDGSSFTTALYDLKVIGQLPTARKLPYFILSGTTCDQCDENVSIYIYSPSDGPMKNEAEQRRFAYPGRETNSEDGSLEYESRMFFGNCLVGHQNAVIWFQRSLSDDKKWHEGVFLVEVKDDQLVTNELRDNLPLHADVQKAVRRGGCQELPGVNRPSEP